MQKIAKKQLCLPKTWVNIKYAMFIAHGKKNVNCVFYAICDIHTTSISAFQLYVFQLNKFVSNIKVPQKQLKIYKLPQNRLINYI